MTTFHLDLNAHLGTRRNISTYAQASASTHFKGTKDIRALDWCPGLVVCRRHFSLLIFNKQPQLILQFWDVLEYNFCMLPEMSGMDLNRGEAPHRLDRGLECHQPKRHAI